MPGQASGPGNGGRSPIDPLDVGAFIRSQRERAEISIRKLAELADVSNPYLSQIERDSHLTPEQKSALLSVYESFLAAS